ncbi:hypothetical protein ACH4GK_27970 [Streptomyces rimosus]|uniref:hypothetical protein n=1 Tax=Streptomyces rimosus TaxID=1927 RepID=UPI0004CC5E0B|nr:hypothetical protein [Streptomyces rimosus]
MGIELELHSARPARGKASGSTLLHGSYEHGEALAWALSPFVRTGPGKLAWVDPYGDTLFNEQEAQAALPEAAELIERCADASQKAALQDLAALLERCAATPGSYLWFMGD